MSDFPNKVPGEGQVATDTPSTFNFMKLLGVGGTQGAVAFSHDQVKRLKKVYGFTDEYHDKYEAEILAESENSYDKRLAEWKETEGRYRRPPKPTKMTPEEAKKSRRFAEAGAYRNMMRFTERDGLRVMAFLSNFLEPGQDPVKLVGQLCVEAGLDVPDDIEWLYDEE